MQEFPWGHSRRYNDFQSRFRIMFPDMKIQKISVDPGFTCPNRDGSKGKGGCTYCNNAAFTPYFSNKKRSVTEQIETGIRFFSRKYPAMKYLAYFQSFSNTYGPLEDLKTLFEEALSFPGVTGLVIATRPDCVNDEILDYLADLAQKHYIMLELGIESHLDRTLVTINRCHTFADSQRAVEQAAGRKIHTSAHFILGLPGESRNDWLDQARFISQLPVENLKLHQLQIHKATVMAGHYMKNSGDFHLFSVDEYAGLVVNYLELLDPRITVERFTSQAPEGWLIAPDWGLKNHEFTTRVEKLLADRDSWQGKAWRAIG
jgi:uncharacterized protein